MISASLNVSFLVYKSGWVGTTQIIGQWQGCNEGPIRRSLEYSGTSQEAVLVSVKRKKEYALTTYSHRLDFPGVNMWPKAISHLMWFREAERFNILV